MATLARLLRLAGWVLLGALALAGVGLSIVAFLATAPFTRPAIASAVVRIADDAIAGRLELRGIAVLPRGGIELRGLEVYDPDGHLVLAVDRARLFADVTALRSRTVGVAVELDAPSLLLEQEADGGTSLARAFAPAHPTPERPPPRDAEAAASGAGGGWTVHLSSLAVRGADVWWKDASGATRVEASGVDLAGRGTLGPRRARAELRLDGRLRAPIDSPVSLSVVAALAGDAVRVPLLRVEAGGTALSAIGEGDLAKRRGRAAITRLEVSRSQARAVVPAAPEGADLRVVGFGESDGTTLSAAFRVEPVEGDGDRGGGRADAALAGRLDALRRAAGFDVSLEQLDPARLAEGLPAGEVTLTAHGALAGTTLDDVRARVALAMSRSRLGPGEVTRADVALRVADGTVDLDRLTAAAPGVTVEAAGRWRRAGAVTGKATVDARDLAVATRNVARLAGEAPPPLGGRVRLDATLSGTSAAPALAGTLDAPALRAESVSAEGVHLALRAVGPLRELEGQVEGRLAALRTGGRERARQIVLRAAVSAGEGTLSLTGSVPGAGHEPLALEARGNLERGPRQNLLHLRRLALSYPGSRWLLARPATVDLDLPAVDRLDLTDVPQRVVLSGGLGPRGTISAHAELSRLDLARLPAAVKLDESLRGELSGVVDASGSAARPVVFARVSVEDGALGRFGGLAAAVEGRWDGAARRAEGSVSIARKDGGTIDAKVDLPVPLEGRPAERVSARLRASALPVAELLAAAGSSAPAAGNVALDLRIEGSAGAPALAGELTLADGEWADLDGLGATVSVEAPGTTVRVLASGTLGSRRVLGVDATAPLDLAELAARPAGTLRALRRAPLHATASASLDLAAVSGRAGLPAGIAGLLEAHTELTGTAATPRGQATLDLAGGVFRGWRGLGGRIEASAAEAGLAASARVTVEGEEALRVQGTLGVRPERLAVPGALVSAPLRAQAVVPRIALGRAAAGQPLPLSGTVEGRATIGGTPRAPELAVDLTGAGVSVEGRPLGDATATARYAGRRGEIAVTLRPGTGGTLRGTLAATVDLGVGAGAGPLRDAPAEATAVADDLDLGFLPALAPGLVRAAGGKLSMDVRAAGPLARMSPRGTVHLAGGRLAISELGEWTDVALDARVTDDVVELSRLDVRRGPGKLSASGAARGLGTKKATLDAKLSASSFTVARAGMDLATFDVAADATGTWTPSELSVEVNVPRGVVRLPKKTPRTLQPLEERKDIVIGRKAERKLAAVPAGVGPPGDRPEPLTVKAHVIVPRNLFVKSENPKVDVELKADVRYELTEGEDYVSGSIEVVRGAVEPIGGRNFVIEHGAVQFTGGPPTAALLDVQARYTNPAAAVTVKVLGKLKAPEIKLSSEPPMDDTQIAMLIATGRTEVKPGSGGVGTLTGEEAGKAALGAVATQAFRNLVQDKLPLDTVALESGAIRAGKYVTDKIYVGYVRRFDADPTKNQNEDEVRVEYQISPRWIFESRYGNAQSGGASLIWSKDY